MVLHIIYSNTPPSPLGALQYAVKVRRSWTFYTQHMKNSATALIQVTIKQLHIISPKLLLFTREKQEKQRGFLCEPQQSSHGPKEEQLLNPKWLLRKSCHQQLASMCQKHIKDTVSASQLESFICHQFSKCRWLVTDICAIHWLGITMRYTLPALETLWFWKPWRQVLQYSSPTATICHLTSCPTFLACLSFLSVSPGTL